MVQEVPIRSAEEQAVQDNINRQQEINRVYTAQPSDLTQSLVEYEGYKNNLYTLQNPKSGLTMGNGVDFGQHDAESFRKMGVSELIIDKAETVGLFGLQGEAAKDKLAQLKSEGMHIGLFSVGEVAHASNMVTLDSAQNIINEIGLVDWKSRTDGEKTIALSIAHQYGWGTFKGYDAWTQWKTRQYPALQNNLANWDDRTKDSFMGIEYVGRTAAAINARHGKLSLLVPTADSRVPPGLARVSGDMR